MRFPSLAQLQEEGKKAALRFPLSLLFGFFTAALGCWLIGIDSIDDLKLVNVLLTSALGIPLYFCIDVFTENKNLSTNKRLAFWLTGLVVLGLIYLSFPTSETYSSTLAPYIRYTIYNLTIHLMVAFLPHIGSNNQEVFWNYNKDLFIRLIQGIYYSSVIFIGISLALLAINALFDAEINEETFAQIFVITFAFFNTWFFLAGIPENFEKELSLDDYPKGLKIFTQFILVPLLLVYLCILYFYGAKIISTGEWPKGIVSYMIVAISVAGIFTNLLLYPYQQLKESSWIKKFNRGYYIFLLPLVILLFLAIGIRLQDYGLTVNRYIITLMGVWLAFIAIYYAAGQRNIKTIPASLALFMLLSCFGPWGMFSLSEKSQRTRLTEILTDNNLLADNKILTEITWITGEEGAIKRTGELQQNLLSRHDLNEVNSIVQYLSAYHGFENIYPWFDQDLDSLIEVGNRNLAGANPNQLVLESMGLTFIPTYEIVNQNNSIVELNLNTIEEYELEIAAFTYLRQVSLGTWKQDESPVAGMKYSLSIDVDKNANLVMRWDAGELNFDLSSYFQNLLSVYGSGFHTLGSEELSFVKTEDELEIKLQINTLNITDSVGKIRIQNLEGILFVKEKLEE